MNRARALGCIAAGVPDPEAAAWACERIRAWLLHAGADAAGPQAAHVYLGLRSAADGRRQGRDYWLREAAQRLPEAGTWTQAREILRLLGHARRYRERRRMQPDAAPPSPAIEALALALDCCKGAMPGTAQALHNVLRGWPDTDEADAA